VSSVIFARARAQWHAMRRDYQDVLEAQYAAAEEATNGYMVTAEGQSWGWSGWSVFTSNPTTQAAHGSPELLEWLREHPRLTLAEFERQWAEGLDDPDA